MVKDTLISYAYELTLHNDYIKMPTFPVGGVPERSKGTDCKSVGTAFEGSNPSPSTTFFEVFG